MKEYLKFDKGDVSVFIIKMLTALTVAAVTAVITYDKASIIAMSAIGGISADLAIGKLCKHFGLTLGSREASILGIMAGVFITVLVY